mmetsp:Transcript_13276/g.36570  ORF Transcript_13276/g.36570 Transcript_13276/m.36570 type:complete len:218 (-) Transcript_13276:927-1580(-)
MPPSAQISHFELCCSHALIVPLPHELFAACHCNVDLLHFVYPWRASAHSPSSAGKAMQTALLPVPGPRTFACIPAVAAPSLQSALGHSRKCPVHPVCRGSAPRKVLRPRACTHLRKWPSCRPSPAHRALQGHGRAPLCMPRSAHHSRPALGRPAMPMPPRWRPRGVCAATPRSGAPGRRTRPAALLCRPAAQQPGGGATPALRLPPKRTVWQAQPRG